MFFWVCFVFWCCVLHEVEVLAQEPMVMLRQGNVRGIKMYTDTRVPINAFLGIPYISPPLGPLRFSSPARHRGWNSTLVASNYGPACPQLIQGQGQPGGIPGVAGPVDTNEDCLFINVWSPEVSSSAYRGFPVVVFLEGEGFVSGWPGRFPGHELAAEGLVVVSASYRLNVFGFLSFGTPEARGNLGLLDQYFALLWVRENVAAFGGDPGSVTLMGHAAGAARLFQRVVAMSGSPLAPWAGGSRGTAPVVLASHEIARNVGCLMDSVLSTLTCMRSKTTSDLIRAFHSQYKASIIYSGGNWSQIPLPISDSFLSVNDRYQPLELKDALRTVYVPVLIGSTSHDGVGALASWGELSLHGYEQLLRFADRAALPAIMVQAGLARRANAVRELICYQYINRARQGDAEALLEQLIELYTDSQYRAPCALTANIISESAAGAPVYLYQLGGHSALPGSDLLHHTGINVSGAAHGTDVVMMLGPGLLARALGRRLSAAEERLSMSIKRLFVDFIRQGNPTPGSYGYGVSWRRYTPSEGNYFALEVLQTKVQPLPTQGEALWNSLLPKLDMLPSESDASRKLGSEGGELRIDGASHTYKSTTFALGGVALVLATLLALSLVLLRRRSARHRDSAEDAF
ncbi:hypothetical protein B566_EDAN003111 [Ephemera danica]|nr:hypothetical protein B566_EDAN003111 [Ephemera danica]